MAHWLQDIENTKNNSDSIGNQGSSINFTDYWTKYHHSFDVNSSHHTLLFR